MSIKRFIANKDNTITNAFKAGLGLRGTSANMGASDILEVFSIFGQSTTSSLENARMLLEFPINEISAARQKGEIPDSGSVRFNLRLFNAPHTQTTPENFKISVHPISSSWSEGIGLDMENYSDLDSSNWLSSSAGNGWTTPGGDYLTGSYVKDVSFDTGLEDLSVDVSDVVEAWLDSTISQNGFLLRLSGSAEDGATKNSYYTKRFFGRNSEFFLKRPVLEARFDASAQDDRGRLFKSSSLSPAAENLNSICFYNNLRGVLSDIPNTGSNFILSLSTSSTGSPLETVVSKSGLETRHLTASRRSEGVYQAVFAYSGSSDTLYDVWSYTGSNSEGYINLHTGTAMAIKTPTLSTSAKTPSYSVNLTNLKSSYSTTETPTLRLFSKNKSSKPNVYTVSTGKATVDNIDESFYKVTRVADNFEVIGYSTGSIPDFSRLSYDISGSYFDLDMSILAPNYLYEISILRKHGHRLVEQEERFRFRVDP